MLHNTRSMQLSEQSQRLRAEAPKRLSELLSEAERTRRFGVISVEVTVQDGRIQHYKVTEAETHK
jgi:uncharacterized protein with FMN-binding domain